MGFTLLNQVLYFLTLECPLQSIVPSLSCTKIIYDVLEVPNTDHSELKKNI